MGRLSWGPSGQGPGVPFADSAENSSTGQAPEAEGPPDTRVVTPEECLERKEEEGEEPVWSGGAHALFLRFTLWFWSHTR